MHISEQGLALIRRFEGFCSRAYRCPAGYWTIGYGHRIRAREDFAEGITPAEAEALLKQDAEQAALAVLRHVQVELAQGQLDALTSFVFNVGEGAFAASTLLKRLNGSDYAAVPEQLRRWVHAGGEIMPGLVARREAEAGVFTG